MSCPFVRPLMKSPADVHRKRSSADPWATDAGRAHRALAEMVARTSEPPANLARHGLDADDAPACSWWPV
jgi:hypothetical protein